MTDQLSSLQKMSVIVADTADFSLLAHYKPQDATTNPSLILQASKSEDKAVLLDNALRRALAASGSTTASFAQLMELALEFLLVEFGKQILQRIPADGRVSIEVDARLSFDTVGSIRKARRIVAIFEADGVPRSRLYIKLASTWEGIRAAEVLEKEGIACNLTLLFSFAQAVACAQAGASLISPFVGRVLDWYKKNSSKDADFSSVRDPGVIFVRKVYSYYKTYGYKTTVMAASFRTTDEIRNLAGCDKITIAPKLLDELKKTPGSIPRALVPQPASADAVSPKLTKLTRPTFEAMHNDDAMASEKLAEGIRAFSADTVLLENIMAQRLIKMKRSKI
jgi:transaldolase